MFLFVFFLNQLNCVRNVFRSVELLFFINYFWNMYFKLKRKKNKTLNNDDNDNDNDDNKCICKLSLS